MMHTHVFLCVATHVSNICAYRFAVRDPELCQSNILTVPDAEVAAVFVLNLGAQVVDADTNFNDSQSALECVVS